MGETGDKGERIAKAMARAGVASRRDAEKMILAGRVKVNGVKVTSPALDVLPTDKVTLDGKPIDAPQETRLWLYYKPLGLVTSEKDEKGRQTVFDTLPEGMPRVMSVGRLDLNSEGLLLLTNDGGLKRRLELPSTGWLRKYRVRVNGQPNNATFDPLRRGIVIDGEEFQPMEVALDRQQGANAWLTVGIREGKNREVRRAMAEVGLIVNRLIRVSYGPFRLNEMQPGDVVEVKRRVLRDQLGSLLTGEEPQREGSERARGDRGEGRPDRGAAPRRDREGGERRDGDRPFRPRSRDESGADRKPRGPRPEGSGDREWKPRAPRTEGADRKPRGPRPEGAGEREWKPRAPRTEGADRKPRGPKPGGKGPGGRPRGPKPGGRGER
ncbi:pseudouridine synthase [Ostreiculturibacter nitratireducens]|uniref:pseudouridine synthase n=1 Tax=Ostreiculturibacter nitratireducens TaxID=3075226 RepID=UPI0031B615C1